MKFIKTKFSGAFLIEAEPFKDHRGLFSRSWCMQEFQSHGLQTRICQINTSFNYKKGTIRGLHFQKIPYQEAKLVRCIRGGIYDVIVDIRPNSPTFLQWIGFNLTDTNHRSLFVPEGMAHGYQTLIDNTEVYYQVSEFYRPEASLELRWNDPDINITWPLELQSISEKDANASLASDLFIISRESTR